MCCRSCTVSLFAITCSPPDIHVYCQIPRSLGAELTFRSQPLLQTAASSCRPPPATLPPCHLPAFSQWRRHQRLQEEVSGSFLWRSRSRNRNQLLPISTPPLVRSRGRWENCQRVTAGSRSLPTFYPTFYQTFYPTFYPTCVSVEVVLCFWPAAQLGAGCPPE